MIALLNCRIAMKLLLDQGLPRSAASLLCDMGIYAIHVADIGYSQAEDAEIIQRAKEENYVVVTLDADFHALLALNEAISPSVIRIRIERLRAKQLTDLLLTVINECRDELEQGSAITVEISRIRIRRLPLVNRDRNF
jgi:predicted nuclease of predicted toxin-antitoxin system